MSARSGADSFVAGKKFMRRFTQVVFFLLLPGLAWAQSASGRSSSERQSTSEQDQKQSELERYREALEVIGTSLEIPVVVEALKVLRNGYPRSREILLEAVSARRSRTRALALRLLTEKGMVPEDLRLVRKALKDSWPAVRLAAVMAIRALGKDGYSAIETYLPHESEPNIRKMAVKTLEIWGEPDAIPFLARLLKREKNRNVRMFIVDALQELSGQELGDDLVAWESFAQGYSAHIQRGEIVRYLEEQERLEAMLREPDEDLNDPEDPDTPEEWREW